MAGSHHRGPTGTPRSVFHSIACLDCRSTSSSSGGIFLLLLRACFAACFPSRPPDFSSQGHSQKQAVVDFASTLPNKTPPLSLYLSSSLEPPALPAAAVCGGGEGGGLLHTLR